MQGQTRFQCPKGTRRRGYYWRQQPGHMDVQALGPIRFSSAKGSPKIRQALMRCNECGHEWWSRHPVAIYLAEMLARKRP